MGYLACNFLKGRRLIDSGIARTDSRVIFVCPDYRRHAGQDKPAGAIDGMREST
jgi:hypothetical protein